MELRFLDFLQTIHTPLLDKILAFITSLGNAGIIWIVLAVVLLILPKTRKTGIIVAAALLMDLILCNLILKNLVARVRPYDVNTAIAILIKKPLDFSFPSGHTAASFAAMTALFLAKMKKAWIAALVLAVLIAFSRLYFYVHYPTDVLGGAVVGILSGIIGYAIVEKIDKRRKVAR
ncbi:MAG: phosphatase PAP2 family protein [Clostridium sp.]|jgi:membrane-associated phospholipid phosphatase|nr:phosphatase PAP2 family protein [Lachnospiraceae bacterium]MDD6178633.1 phosphatase PAP2 family protein [Clostridium sp.]